MEVTPHCQYSMLQNFVDDQSYDCSNLVFLWSWTLVQAHSNKSIDSSIPFLSVRRSFMHGHEITHNFCDMMKHVVCFHTNYCAQNHLNHTSTYVIDPCKFKNMTCSNMVANASTQVYLHNLSRKRRHFVKP